jgi:hypothetical protein
MASGAIGVFNVFTIRKVLWSPDNNDGQQILSVGDKICPHYVKG